MWESRNGVAAKKWRIRRNNCIGMVVERTASWEILMVEWRDGCVVEGGELVWFEVADVVLEYSSCRKVSSKKVGEISAKKVSEKQTTNN